MRRVTYIASVSLMLMILFVPMISTQETVSARAAEATRESPWYDYWSRDKNRNKVDDSIEEREGSFDIFISYDQHPSDIDVETLKTYISVQSVYQNFDMIAARSVPKDVIGVMASLPHVVMVEWQGPPAQAGLDVSTRAVKARPSTEYSPRTAWELGYTGVGVNIAIIDSGVDDGHESLTGKFVAGFNAITNTPGNPDDDYGHGTHVAGIAMGTGGAAETYRGVAPDAGLVDVKVLGSDGFGTWDDTVQGIDWCITNKDTFGIDVINLSIYGWQQNSDGTDAPSRAVNRAADAGIVTVAIAGNNGPGRFIGPLAAADKGITVAAVNDTNTVDRADDTVADFSSRGPRDSDGDADSMDELKPDVSAPGVSVMSATWNTVSQYRELDGTSMAAPHVAGICALLLDKDPTLTPAEIKSILHSSAEDRDGAYNPTLDLKYDVAYGWGVVDAHTALWFSDRRGPKIDVLQYRVIQDPVLRLRAMQNGAINVSTQLTQTGDIEALSAGGFTITYEPGYHVCFIGFNIRPLEIQQLRRPELTYWPLADVEFRHALAHSFDQQRYVAQIYGYTATPIQSLVPPTQGGWMNPAVPQHPFNPGNPLATTVYPDDHSTCGILRYAGYTFEDADYSGTVTYPDYWKTPNGDPIPLIEVTGPWSGVDPQKANMVIAWILGDLRDIGLAAIPENDYHGLIDDPQGFWTYSTLVYENVNFDAYITNFKLNSFPDHLYDWFHSSQDSSSHPLRYNAFGVDDPTLDDLLETLKFSLNHTAKLLACRDAQTRLADPENPQGLPVLPIYSLIYFDAFASDLRGIVPSPGFGTGDGGCVALKEPDGPSPSTWTYLNIHWEPGKETYTPDGRTLIQWCLSDTPERRNPLYAGTTSAWEIMDRVFDPLIMRNPYTHEDMPWLAESWETVVTATGMNVTFHLRNDVFWQDGNPYMANDAKFNWMFLRDNQIPRFAPMWQFISDVDVVDDYTVTVMLSTTSQFLIYDLADTAAMLPPPVWSWLDGMPLWIIFLYDPSTFTTKPTGAGPWFGTPQGPSTQLYGTGPFVFDYYDSFSMVYELHQFPGYFRITDDMQAQKVDMFHKVGDVSSETAGVGVSDGWVWSSDRGQMGLRYGRNEYLDPTIYHPYVDINRIEGYPMLNWIDVVDLSLAGFHFGEKREYP